jgi:hypothetical protein
VAELQIRGILLLLTITEKRGTELTELVEYATDNSVLLSPGSGALKMNVAGGLFSSEDEALTE